MTVYVALLHSIVLGGGRRVVMSDLRAMTEGLGFTNVRTLVATGNLVFEAKEQPIDQLEARLEAGFAKSFGKHVDIIARDGETWRRLAADNPFGNSEGSEVIVRVMRDSLDPSVLTNLEKRRSGAERLAVINGDLWIDFAGKASETRLLSALTTQRLGVGTMRNWNSVRGILDMVCSDKTTTY